MPDQLAHRAGALGAHLVMAVADQPVQEDGGHLTAGQILHHRGGFRGRRHDHAVHAPLVQQLDDLALVLRVVVRIGEQQAVAGLQGARLDALEDLGEVRVADRRDRQADRAGAGGDQGAGQGVVGVAELVDRAEHRGAGVGADRTGLVQHMRDRGDGDPRTPRHIRHRRHPALPPRACGTTSAPRPPTASSREVHHITSTPPET